MSDIEGPRFATRRGLVDEALRSVGVHGETALFLEDFLLRRVIGSEEEWHSGITEGRIDEYEVLSVLIDGLNQVFIRADQHREPITDELAERVMYDFVMSRNCPYPLWYC